MHKVKAKFPGEEITILDYYAPSHKASKHITKQKTKRIRKV